jgi:hypothetical protein
MDGLDDLIAVTMLSRAFRLIAAAYDAEDLFA